MSSKSTASKARSKPEKPHPGFATFAHPSGQRAKKTRGQLVHFDVWADPEAGPEVSVPIDAISGQLGKLLREHKSRLPLIRRLWTLVCRFVMIEVDGESLDDRV